ncbi:hypothetical protein D3C87_1753870 [compost metagenome]
MVRTNFQLHKDLAQKVSWLALQRAGKTAQQLRHPVNIIRLIAPGQSQVLFFQIRTAKKGILHRKRGHFGKVPENLMPVVITGGVAEQADKFPAVMVIAVLPGVAWQFRGIRGNGRRVHIQCQLRHSGVPSFSAACSVLPPCRTRRNGP